MTGTLRHILCIDDEPDILEVVTLCLETVGGFRVTPCANGFDGIEKAMALKPDLMLIDVMMPEIDGPGTLALKKTRADLDNIPVIFMTARIQPSEYAEYKRLGAAGVIAKPFNPITISDEIREIWNAL